MASKIVLFLAVVALVYSQSSGQLFGGVTRLPMGGYSDTIGFRGDPFWGYLYQAHNIVPQFPSPMTYRAGADFSNVDGHGLSGSFSMNSGIGGEGMVKGIFPMMNNPIHQVDGMVQIDRNLNRHFNPIGPQKDTFGVNYKNVDGATASFSQSQIHGRPASKTIEASIPVVIGENHKLTLTGENQIGSQKSLGVGYENLASGATASLTGTQTKVGPARGMAAVSVPFANVGPATVTVEGGSTFGHGMKPDNQVGVKVSIPLD